MNALDSINPQLDVRERRNVPRASSRNEVLQELVTELPQHVSTVARWVAHLGGPGIEVADTTQEVFLIAQRNLPRFRGESKLSTWLYGITLRVLRHRRRKERMRRWFKSDAREAAERIPSQEPSAATQLEHHQRRERVYRLLNRLPDKQRQAIILSEYEELPHAEIAELLDAKPSTIAVWIHRGKAQLIQWVRELEGEEARP